MGLFITEWLMGEEEFTEYCKKYWKPHMRFVPHPQIPGALCVEIHLLSKEGELTPPVPDHYSEKIKKEFYSRYGLSAKKLIEHIDPDIFNKVSERLNNEELTEELVKEINDEFEVDLYILESTEGKPLYTHLVSLIFFDSWEPIPHYKFLIKSL